MANQNKELQLSEENFDFDELEKALEQELDAKTLDLELATKDREKIGNPESLAETVGNVVWEQFINQVASIAGDDFKKENYKQIIENDKRKKEAYKQLIGGDSTEKGFYEKIVYDDFCNNRIPLDLRYSAHIQTPENFEKGKIATHNYQSIDKLEENYKRYKDTPHSKFRDKFVDKGMDKTLERAGTLYKKGIGTVTDIYTGRQISTQTRLEDGRQNPNAAEREHVIPSAKLSKDSSLQMANTSNELADIINNPENLQGYTTAKRNRRKSDSSPIEMEERDKNKHWEKANKKAEEFIDKTEKEGEARLKQEGRETWTQEGKLIGGKAIRTLVMTLLAALIKEVIQKLIAWFRAGKKSISTFIDSVKESVKSFLSNLKRYLIDAGSAVMTTIFTAIIGPIVGTIKKSWILLKQGYKSIKKTIDFFKEPANKNMPFSIKVMEAGKIITTGIAAGGAILLSEAIEKGLMTFPAFAYPIPLLGSLASLLGLFFGALISGIIGAIALNLIDKLIAGKQRELADKKIIEAGNHVLNVQSKQIELAKQRTAYAKEKARTTINNRHTKAAEFMKETITDVKNIGEQIAGNKLERQTNTTVEDDLQAIYNLLNKQN